MLADYLASVAARRWEPGDLDCCTFMADWCLARGLADPMADRRGTYDDARTFRRMLQSEGGIVRSCTVRLEAVGLSATATPGPGDVALALTPYARRSALRLRPIGAIFIKPCTVALVTSDMGLLIVQRPIIKAWTING